MSTNSNRSFIPTCAMSVALVILTLWASACGPGDPTAPSASATRGAEKSDDWTMKRDKMVKKQIEARGVRDPAVLVALRKVERHRFVPTSHRASAYEDCPLPIGENQTISQPYIVGLMTEMLEIEPGAKILEIGTGSGYQAAILGEIAAEVYTIEIVEPLGERARKLLDELGYKNVHVRVGDGYQGWPEEAPFDGIIVTAAPESVPQPLIDQLKPGARLIIPVGKANNQRLKIIEKTADGVKTENDIAVRFVPMTGEALEK